MNVAELFALIGLEWDKSSDKDFDGKLDGFAGKLAAWADKSAEFLTKSFTAFFLNDLYEVAKAGIGRVVALLNPADVFETVKGRAGDLDAIAKQARALSITTEALQRYQFIAGQNGIVQTQFDMAISKTNRAVGEAGRGNVEYAKTFRELGLSYRDLAKLSAEARFDKVLETLAGVTDETKRAALGAKLFGDEAFPKFASLLKGGADGLRQLREQADRLGFVISDADAQKAEAFNDALDRTTRAAGSLKDRALNPLYEPLTRLLKGVEDFVVQNADLLALPFEAFGAAFALAFDTAADAIVFVVGVIGKLRSGLKTLLKSLGGVEQLLKIVTALTIGFGVAWAWTRSGSVVLFLQTLAVELIAVAVRLVLAAEAAFLFLKNLTLASAWAAIKAGFTRLIALLTSTTAQMIILALFVAGVLLLLEDVYQLFDGGNSAIGDFFNIDPNSAEDIKLFQDVLLGIGIALGVILALLTGIPGLIAILAVMIVYLAANWELVLVAFENFYDYLVEGLSDLFAEFLNWGDSLATSLADTFRLIFNVIRDWIKDIIRDIADIPNKARGIIARLPGASLLGLDGGEVVAGAFGGGAASPAVDQAARVYQNRNNRAVSIAPNIQVQVDAKDRTASDAADIFKGAVFDELFRELDQAYEGDES